VKEGRIFKLRPFYDTIPPKNWRTLAKADSTKIIIEFASFRLFRGFGSFSANSIVDVIVAE
jgi:hypothetical protein